MSVEKQHEIVSEILALFLGMFFLYAFWYQYAYAPVEKVLPLMGIVIVFLSLCNIKRVPGYYRDLLPVFVFAIYIALFGLISAYDVTTSKHHLMNICEYLIPMIGVYVYIDSDYKKFLRVLKMLVISTIMICLSSLANGHVTNTGAIIVGTLNANVESSLLALGVISSMLLLFCSRTKKFEKIILLASILIFVKTQIDCASRRGFAVLVFLIVAGLLVAIRTRYRDNKAVKWLTLLAVICGFLAILTTLSETLGGSVLFERFSSKGNEGDRLRKVYQAKAFSLFLQSPLLGTGLGYVAVYAGMYSHSMYYELLACTGIIGTTIIVGVLVIDMYRLFLYSNRINQNNEDLIICARCMMLFALAVLLGGFAVVYIYDMYFYVMLGLIASACKVIRCYCE